jgi:hypothetical protein
MGRELVVGSVVSPGASTEQGVGDPPSRTRSPSQQSASVSTTRHHETLAPVSAQTTARPSTPPVAAKSSRRMRRYPQGRVLVRQADGERAQSGKDRGAPGLGRRRGPPAGDESAVRAQHRCWCQQQLGMSAARQRPNQRRNEGTVGPAHPRLRRGSAEHGELMAQHEDLDMVRGLGPGEQHHEGHEPSEHQVDQLRRHRRIMPTSVGPSGSSRSTPWAQFRAPTRQHRCRRW